MKKILLALAVTGFILGCSRPRWLAKIYIVKAENAFAKAHALRVDPRISYEARLKYYREACTGFLKAYRYDPQIFTLYRIESAADSCLRVEDHASVQLFRRFEEKYAREHPTEVTYGDAGVGMMLE